MVLIGSGFAVPCVLPSSHSLLLKPVTPFTIFLPAPPAFHLDIVMVAIVVIMVIVMRENGGGGEREGLTKWEKGQCLTMGMIIAVIAK